MQTMTLRRGAAWFVVAVIAPPLLAGALLVQRSAQAAETDALAHVDDAVGDAQAAYDTTAARLADQAQILADRNAAEQVTTDRPTPARRWVRAELDDPRAIGRADLAVLVRRDRTPLASAVADDAVDVAARLEEIADAVTGEPPPGLLLHSRALWPAGRFVGWVITGRVIDDVLLRALPADARGTGRGRPCDRRHRPRAGEACGTPRRVSRRTGQDRSRHRRGRGGTDRRARPDAGGVAAGGRCGNAGSGVDGTRGLGGCGGPAGSARDWTRDRHPRPSCGHRRTAGDRGRARRTGRRGRCRRAACARRCGQRRGRGAGPPAAGARRQSRAAAWCALAARRDAVEQPGPGPHAGGGHRHRDGHRAGGPRHAGADHRGRRPGHPHRSRVRSTARHQVRRAEPARVGGAHRAVGPTAGPTAWSSPPRSTVASSRPTS